MNWAKYLDLEQDRFINELLDFVRIPSVSAKPENIPDVRHAADWVCRRLTAAGVDSAQVIETDGHPVVYGHWLKAGPDKPTVLVYGHFDVQPAEPMEQWTTPPFEPQIRDGRIWGRGTSDNKGGMLIPILAVEALLKSFGSLPVNVKFFFEGEEEIGSPSLAACIAANAEKLKADMIFSADGLQHSPEQPQLVNGLKGTIALEVVVRGPHSDQHSGIHGPGIANPALALSQLLATFKSADGRVTIEGFYDGVVPLDEEERQAVAALPFDETAYLAETGAPSVHGEPRYSVLERVWARPMLDVNGLTSGWQGAGSKTVLPAEARAKITCRLVAAQDPDHVIAAIRAHVDRFTPTGVTAEVVTPKRNSAPFLVPRGHNASAVAAKVLERTYGRTPLRTRLGGSIPVMSVFLRVLGVHGVMLGFSHADENLHAPDEFFRLDAFRKGQMAYGLLFEELGKN